MADRPRRIGAYRVLRVLGQGGMGVVYLAEGPDGGEVAVKVIRGERVAEPGYQRRFEREVGILRRVAESAPFCTVAILDSGVSDDAAYLVTEYVDGPDLARRVREDGPLGPDELVNLGIWMASALGALHAAGVIHRDLKPGNVLLGPTGPKIIDFGVAQVVSGTLGTVTHSAVGTAGYLSPEQARGDPLTTASDVFSWGAVMAFAATGRSPFGEGSNPEVTYRVVYAEPDLDGVAEPPRELIAWAMHKTADRRPDAERLHAALTSPGEGVPVDSMAWTVPDPAGPGRPSAGRGSRAAQRLAGLAVAILGVAGALTMTGAVKVVAAALAALGLIPLLAPVPWRRRRHRWIGVSTAVAGLLLPLNAATGAVPIGMRTCEEPGQTAARPLAASGFDTTGKSSVKVAGGLWKITSNGDYTWTGLAGALPDWCGYQVDLDVTVHGPTQDAYAGLGWGYGLGVCSRFDGSQPRGLSLQYAFYQGDQEQSNHLGVVRLPAANAHPGAQPADPPRGLDNSTHHWRILYDHGKVAYQLDYGITQTAWYPATGGYPLLADCLGSQFVFRAWLAEVEVGGLTISPG
ncbi:serine/threonine protein kinase [Streptosporangiaceae bacterium NEAU-GS5]|nr:serine/threonine protein kinase [Streptosporangiaceae bacterium NEAU-GS5]